jgi:hypothetical protein
VFELVDALLKKRKKRRMMVLGLVMDVVRYLMLTRALKLPGYRKLSPTFVAGCGILEASLSLFKLFIKSSQVVHQQRINK